ncbi:hypothetical protein [Cohaesibacter intestini]|uniref:hypothetical protein n=1 Tax=Cohaesibacter intestini TaxID=2211145 RepID=UPI0013007245|nr:hypothetical protein [Cohaesibacter intestini]
MASEMLKRCPTASADERITRRQSQIAQFGEFLINSLASRATKLSPGLTSDAAAGQVRMWLSRQAKNTSDYRLCTMASNSQLLKIIASFQRLDTRRWLRAYAARSDVKIEPVPLDSNKLLKSYALPAFQQVVLKSIAKSHSPRQCTQPFVEKIDLIRKKRTETINQPAYVLDALSFIERWEFSCIGRRYWVEVSFSRDNDGMLGLYSISGN